MCWHHSAPSRDANCYLRASFNSVHWYSPSLAGIKSFTSKWHPPPPSPPFAVLPSSSSTFTHLLKLHMPLPTLAHFHPPSPTFARLPPTFTHLHVGWGSFTHLCPLSLTFVHLRHLCPPSPTIDHLHPPLPTFPHTWSFWRFWRSSFLSAI